MPQALGRSFDHIAYAQRERLAYIEVRSYFCGHLTRTQIENRFDIRPAASARDLIAYRDIAPGNLLYNASLRCYQPSLNFKPVFQHSARHVLHWLRSGSGDGLEIVESTPRVPCDWAQDLVHPDLDVLATVTRAISAGFVLEVSYLSLSSGMSVKRLSPLALADTGFRWHVRAFDQERNRFADFVLTRLTSVRATTEPIPVSQRLEADTQWNRQIQLEIVPHPGLKHPLAIETDFGMTNGRLALTVRAPLAGYALKRWSVDCSPAHSLSPLAHQLWLRNPSVLQGVDSAVLAPGFSHEMPMLDEAV